MDQNPYAAPSPEADARLAQARSEEAIPWFAVSTRKLAVMSILTIGLYVVHWFERQYRFQKRLRGEETWPLARAIFSVFFAHELFRRVEAAAYRVDVRTSWSSGPMGTIFVVSAIAGRIIERVGNKLVTGTAASVLGLIGFATLFGLVYPVVQVQGTVNDVLERERPGFERNDHFTAWNWLAMAFGAMVLGLAIFGFVAPQGDQKAQDDSMVEVSNP